MKKLKLAVVGAGHLGRIHAKLLAARHDVELVAVVDPSPTARDSVAADCGTAGLESHQSIVSQVDGAIIATPTRLHHAVAIDFLRAGVSLLIEKPLAATAAEADEILAAAKAGGATVQVGHIERFNPALRAAEPWITRPKFIEAVRASGFTCRSIDIGVVLDLMIHDLDIVLALAGAPLRRVSALGLAVLGRNEDIAHARLEFTNGCVANLSASRVSYAMRRRMQLWSEAGFAEIDFADRTARIVVPSDAVAERRIDATSLPAAERDALKENLFQDYLRVEDLPVEPRNALGDEQTDFVEAIRTGRMPRVTGEDGLRALQVAEQILASLETHAWDGRDDGPMGPLFAPTPSVLRGPHWTAPRPGAPAPAPTPAPLRREAG